MSIDPGPQRPVVGDTERDLLAAQAAGCEPHLILSGRSARLQPEQVQVLLANVPKAHVHGSLNEFADFLLQRDHHPDSGIGRLA